MDRHVAVTRIKVRLTPRGGRDELVAFDGEVLRARVAAAPVDGKANRALCRLLAKRLGVAPSRVTVERGEKSRVKRIRVEGVEKAAVESALGGL